MKVMQKVLPLDAACEDLEVPQGWSVGGMGMCGWYTSACNLLNT